MTRNLLNLLSLALLAAFLVAAPARFASADDKKGGDNKGDGHDKKSKEEEKKREEEARKKREIEEKENWDKRGEDGGLAWPEPPDVGEMMDTVKGKSIGIVPGGGCTEPEPKPGVGGYRKVAVDGEAEAADAAGGAFGEGAKEREGNTDGEKKDDKKEEKKGEKKEGDKKEEKKEDKK